jgi:hypothetical protein
LNSVQLGKLPKGALLEKYRLDGAYTDCYFVDLPKLVRHAEYVEAFYTTAVFKIERQILALVARRPSSDCEARLLARGEVDRFAAWTVEARTQNQLLLCDFLGRTRSWLMSVGLDGGDATRLYFGSAVVPKRNPTTGQVSFGAAFYALGGFHRAYSRVLLGSACSRIAH